MAGALTTDDLMQLAHRLGAFGAGVGSADPFRQERVALDDARNNGRSGPLHFTYDEPAVATDIRRSFSWAKRIVTVSHAYVPGAASPAPSGALIARFASADRYEPLRAITSSIAGHIRDHGYRAESLIDDNRLVDRAAAVRSGIAWAGKSTMMLTPGPGPWILLGSVVTDAPLETTPPMVRSCGTCTACLPACPTGALDERGLDARRCLSTWLQSPGSLPLAGSSGTRPSNTSRPH